MKNLMSVATIPLILIVVVASGANLERGATSGDSIIRNVSILETINNVVKDLINQTTFITSVTSASAEKNRTSTQPKIEQVSRKQKGILGFWTWHEITPSTTKGLEVDSLNEDIESEEEYSSSETESNKGQRNGSSSDDVNSPNNIPNFHLSIKIERDNPYISENLALLNHLNQTIERLREFNDNYEKLVADNKAINRNLQTLKNSSLASMYPDFNVFTKNNDAVYTMAVERTKTIKLQQLSNNHSLFTTRVLNLKTSEATTPLNNDNIISGIRANLMT